MYRSITRAFALGAGLTVLAFGATQFTLQASAQSGDGWVTLLDDKMMGDWGKLGETNWGLEDGAVVADKDKQGRRLSDHQKIL